MVLKAEIKAVTDAFMDPASLHGPEGDIMIVAYPFMHPASFMVLKVESKAVTNPFMDPASPHGSEG